MTYINTKQILTLSIEKATYPTGESPRNIFFIEILMTNGKRLTVENEEGCTKYFSGEEKARTWLLSKDIINQLTRI